MKRSTDTISAKLTPREAVLNRNAAELLGRDAIKRLNDHGNMLSKRGVDLASLQSDPAPYPASENLAGYEYGPSDVPPTYRGLPFNIDQPYPSIQQEAGTPGPPTTVTYPKQPQGSQPQSPPLPNQPFPMQPLLPILPQQPIENNTQGYQRGTSSVRRDDRADLLKDAENTFYGGGQAPMPTPTPTPQPNGYQYGTADVYRQAMGPVTDEERRRGRRTNAASRIQGINLSPDAMRGIPSRAANATSPRGSAFSDTGVAGGAYLALPPEQNPAYQAAISRGRPARSGYTMIKTPSGGSMSVPIGQERKYTDLLFKGNPTADTGFQRPTPTSAYALGDTGAAPTGNTPFEQSFRMGQTGGREGGVVQQPQPSFGFQVGNVLRNTAPGALAFATNAASRVGNAVAGFFGGGGSADTSASTAAPVAPIQNTALQNVQAMQQGDTAQQALQPRRYSDYY